MLRALANERRLDDPLQAGGVGRGKREHACLMPLGLSQSALSQHSGQDAGGRVS